MTDILDDKVELKVGHIVNGVVKFVCSEFAIVTVDNLDFILPAQEYSWNFREKLEQYLHEGDKVTCVVVKIENTKVMVSIKRCSYNPWLVIDKRYSVGQCLKLKVENISYFGAFIYVEPHIRGLLHTSEICLHGRIPIESVLDKGDIVNVWIKDIDKKECKFSFTIKPFLKESWQKFIEKYKENDVIESTIKYYTKKVLYTEFEGVYISLTPEESGLKGDENIKSKFTIGKTESLKIDKIDTDKFTVTAHIVA